MNDKNNELRPIHSLNVDEAPKHAHVKHANFDIHKKTKSSYQRKKRRRRIIYAIVLLVAVGGAFYYLNIVNKSTKQTAEAPAPSSQETEPDERFFYQLGNRVISYDIESKQPETLTDKLPANARVLDVYADNDTWRLYAENQIGNSSDYQLIYLEKNIDPRILATAKESNGSAAANAQVKLIAYSEMATVSGNLLPTRTIVIGEDGKKRTVYTSELLSFGSDQLGLKDPRYVVSDVSPDGKKLLLSRINCFNCDGGASATSLEYDLASNRATQVYISNKLNGEIAYTSNGYLIHEANTSDLVNGIRPYDEKFLTLDKPGGTPKVLFASTEKDWAGVSFDGSLDYLILEKRAKDYDPKLNIDFGGFFNRDGSSGAKGLKKLEITEGVDFKKETLRLGGTNDACFSALVDSRNASIGDNTLRIGVLCRGDGDKFSFTEIDKTPANATPQYVQLLD